MYDAIVIGGGPAGISASVYLKRFKLNVIVIMKDYGTLAKTDHIENYYGFEEPITGVELVEKGINQAQRLNIEIFFEEVLNILYNDDETFTVKTNKKDYSSKSVLLATGSNRVNLRVKGFNDFVGKGISYCAICDGFLYRNKRIGLVGTGEYMKEELEVLKDFSSDITIFTNNQDLEVDVKDFKMVNDEIIEIKGENLIEKVVTKNGEYAVDALFLALGTPSAADFALKMGAETNRNEIVVDENFMTNIPGLFAGGDCIGGIYQISKSVSDGTKAAIHMNKYLKKKIVHK